MPLYALTPEGDRVLPVKGARGRCPYCDAGMVAKCGEVVPHHWAHRAGTACAASLAKESAWHLAAKARFAAAGAEVEVHVRRGRIAHVADVLLDGRVIELAGTYPDVGQVREREAFYGPDMWWIYNAGMWIARMDERHGVTNAAPVLTAHERTVLWDVYPDSPLTSIRRVVDFTPDDPHVVAMRPWEARTVFTLASIANVVAYSLARPVGVPVTPGTQTAPQQPTRAPSDPGMAWGARDCQRPGHVAVQDTEPQPARGSYLASLGDRTEPMSERRLRAMLEDPYWRTAAQADDPSEPGATFRRHLAARGVALTG